MNSVDILRHIMDLEKRSFVDQGILSLSRSPSGRIECAFGILNESKQVEISMFFIALLRTPDSSEEHRCIWQPESDHIQGKLFCSI